jgi:copper(I)-binding protein
MRVRLWRRLPRGSPDRDGHAADIPSGDSLHLQPGGMHLMLTALKQLPKAGDRLTLSLRFARVGEIVLDVPVRPYAP